MKKIIYLFCFAVTLYVNVIYSKVKPTEVKLASFDVALLHNSPQEVTQAGQTFAFLDVHNADLLATNSKAYAEPLNHAGVSQFEVLLDSKDNLTEAIRGHENDKWQVDGLNQVL
jgi:hypothetical protein